MPSRNHNNLSCLISKTSSIYAPTNVYIRPLILSKGSTKYHWKKATAKERLSPVS
ncbi:unnamed protein product [Cylicostephanus goldi]|uniref:Uncharacterized protein n=1 Tax=Cylicostephanus goldi TaxID=71465 RepID=A0A3P6PZQ4_CYLGO|nr:unnamed protein product [Cylicostephanus goldi]